MRRSDRVCCDTGNRCSMKAAYSPDHPAPTKVGVITLEPLTIVRRDTFALMMDRVRAASKLTICVSTFIIY